MATIWLYLVSAQFSCEQLSNPPISLDFGEAAVEWLTNLVSAWALAGLAYAQTDASSHIKLTA
jgi:hypothetical protein